MTWGLEDDYAFSAFSPGGEGETVTVGDGWGQRDHRGTDRGVTLPYVLRAREGAGHDAFVSVFAGGPASHPLVRGVRCPPLPSDGPADAVMVEVQTALGTDLILSMVTPRLIRIPTSMGELAADGRVAVALGATGEPESAALIGGTQLTVAAAALSCPRGSYQGKVLDIGSASGASWFVLEGSLPNGGAMVGKTLFIEAGGLCRAYPIRAVKTRKARTRVSTKVKNLGFEAREGERWEFLPTVWWAKD
jgi:hypothetical protein